MSLLLPGEPCGVFASRSLYEMRLPPGSDFRTPWRWKGRASFGSQFPLYPNYNRLPKRGKEEVELVRSRCLLLGWQTP